LKKTIDEEEVKEVKKVSSVQSRLANWNNLATDGTVSTDSQTVAERTAEAKSGTALKDRVNVWAKKEEEPQNLGPRKEPIKIDYGF